MMSRPLCSLPVLFPARGLAYQLVVHHHFSRPQHQSWLYVCSEPPRVCHSEGLLSLDAYPFLKVCLHCNVAAAKLQDAQNRTIHGSHLFAPARVTGLQRDLKVAPDRYSSVSSLHREGGFAGEIEVAEMQWHACVASASPKGGDATETGRSAPT